jgi:hypothetical protein
LTSGGRIPSSYLASKSATDLLSFCCVISADEFAFTSQSHVCVLQTALQLISLGYGVHVLADGVSSCNKEEVPIALNRIQQAGGMITTSESAVFQLMGKVCWLSLERPRLNAA